MFGKNKAITPESMEEFLARGGKVKKLDAGDCARKRVDKMKRLHKRLTDTEQFVSADRVKQEIERYSRKEFNPWYAEKK